MVSRQTLLLVALAALIGLQGPLCELACSSGPVAVAAQDATETAPCHQTRDTPEPLDPPTHEACGCASFDAPVLASGETSAEPPAWAAAVVGPPVAEGPGLVWTEARLRPTSLPPPDRLLLHATFLL